MKLRFSLKDKEPSFDANENIKTVVLCLDNDDAWQKACDKFEKLLAEREIAVTRLLPNGKTYDEILKHYYNGVEIEELI